MKSHQFKAEDPRLQALVRECRPAPEMPPGFEAAVWRRIESAQLREPIAASGLEWLAALLLRPRWAIGGLALALVLGGMAGLAQGMSRARESSQQRYIASVSPMSPP